MNDNLLEIENLKTYFNTEEGIIKAVDGVSFSIRKKEIVGIVGESGCGKSVTALSILRLVPDPPGKIVGGKVLFKNRNLLALSSEELRKFRGNEISMIFQEPMTSLNPVFKVGDQVAEAIQLHQNLKKKEAIEKTIEMFKSVRIPASEKRINEYPHQMSGGMKQRVMIAMALSCNPSLLIADEPTTALDVTIQAQILELIFEIRERFGMAVLLITHDLGIVAEIVEKVIVMYLGKIVETALVYSLFNNPKHPYTRGLLESIPKISDDDQNKLKTIPGTVPGLGKLPIGCKFYGRCSDAIEQCKQVEPELIEIDSGHSVRCWLYR